MEPMGPPWNAPGVLPDCDRAIRETWLASGATIVIQEKNGVKLATSALITSALDCHQPMRAQLPTSAIGTVAQQPVFVDHNR